MQYKDVQKPEIIKGFKLWENKLNGFTVAMVHYTADPYKDPDRKGKEWFKRERKGFPKAKWLKEYEIDSTTKSGSLIYGPEYCDFNDAHHFIKSFKIPEPYELLISLDFGQRNPTAGLVAIWTRNKKLYIIDEYYKPNIPSKSSKEMFEKFAVYMGRTEAQMRAMSIEDKRRLAMQVFSTRVIDPSTTAKNRVKRLGSGEEIEYSIIEEFWDNGWDFEPGNNDVSSGITRIREYFQIENNQSHLYVFADKCPNLCREIKNYRYKEFTELQGRTRNKSEDPVKKNDHGCDSLKYLIMTRPKTPKLLEKPKTKIQKDIENLLRPKIITNDWDVDN